MSKRGRARRALRAAKRQAAQKPHDPIYGQTSSSKFRKLKRWLRNKLKKRRKIREQEYNRDNDILSAIDEDRKIDKRNSDDTEE